MRYIICGDYTWSVEVCMFDCAPTGYYNQLKTMKNFEGITRPIISEKFGIDIEVYSQECGMCFEEHYLVENGDGVIAEVVEYHNDYDEEKDEYIKRVVLKIGSFHFRATLVALIERART